MTIERWGSWRWIAVALVGCFLFGILYLVTAWLVVMNTDACWWPWHDILPGKAHLCSVGM